MVADAVLKLREQAIELCRIKREEEALELFERAAEGGDYLSDVYIARHLLSKYCICAGEERLNKVFDAYRSESEPDALLKEAAAEALYVMGNLKKDPFYFKNATQLGCVRAYYRLGYLLYSKGIKHLEEALESWEKGAQAGDSMCVEAYNEHLNEDIKEPIYEGETDQNGLPHGQGVMYYPKTRLKSWCKLKVAPKCYDGQWCHGVKSGKGQMLYYTDNWWSHICYIGSWNNDMPEGTGRLYKSFRDVAEHTLVQIFCYEGDWVAGIREGFGVEYFDCLTGFKNIAKVIRAEEAKGNVYIGGGEESFGFLAGSFLRDKDGVSACSLAAEAAAWAKSIGTSLYELIKQLYVDYGFYKEGLVSVVRKGQEGAAEIKQMMVDFRANPPKQICGSDIVTIKDYQSSEILDVKSGKVSPLEIDKSNVLQYLTADGTILSIRPSGTEPKIKFYFGVKEPLASLADYDKVSEALDRKIEQMKKELNLV
jgi:hypothetical protein